MAEDDDADYRRRISEVLTKHDFGWVVTQAEAQIAEGKPNSKQVSELESFSVLADASFAIRKPRSRRASLITSEPYSETERLEILLQATEAAIVQRAMIEQEVLDLMSGISSIQFEPDSPAGAARDSLFGAPHTLDPARKVSAVELEVEAKTALTGLRGRDHAGT